MRWGRSLPLWLMIAEGADTAQLDDFVARVQPALERALVARLGVQDGMEAAADAVAYACANWTRLRAMENPAGYLFRVGQSNGRRAFQHRQRHVQLVDDPVTTEHHVDVDLQRALMSLRWEQRVAIVLVYAHGHTYADAARTVNMPLTTFTNHLHRGLTRLRRTLES